mgnify:CR=1 FL=1
MENWKQVNPWVNDLTSLHFLRVLLLEIKHDPSALILPSVVIQNETIMYALTAFRKGFVSTFQTNNCNKPILFLKKQTLKIINY